MNRAARLRSVVKVGLLVAGVCLGQGHPNKKEHQFHGTVQVVNRVAKTLTVNGDKVEGWMEAMTMIYKVDDPSILEKLKPGDQITATVYDGDYSLHKVQPARSNARDSKSNR